MKTMIDIKKKLYGSSIQLHDLSGNRTRVYAVRGRPLDQQAGIEATRFELATSASRTQRSTKLSHASMFLSVCFALFTSDLYILS
jgi:hypothetical protein